MEKVYFKIPDNALKVYLSNGDELLLLRHIDNKDALKAAQTDLNKAMRKAFEAGIKSLNIEFHLRQKVTIEAPIS